MTQIQSIVQLDSGITAEYFQNGEYGQPVILVRKVPGISEDCRYFAAQFLDADAARSPFPICANYNDQEPFEITAPEVSAIASLIRRSVDKSKGVFKTTWVASNPSDLF